MLLRPDDGATNKPRPIVKRIFQEEYIQIKKKQKSESINKCEMILFFVFCVTMLMIVFLQESIAQKYKLQNTLNKLINQENFVQIVDAPAFYNYLDSLLTNELYQDPSSNTPKSIRLATQIQVTQRRINTKTVTMFGESFQQWANQDQGFSSSASAGQSVENTDTYGTNSGSFIYQGKGVGYQDQGGFIYEFDPATYTTTRVPEVTTLANNGWIDDKTNSVVVSFVTYSQPLDQVTVIIMDLRARSNGKFRDNVQVRSIRDSYYNTGRDYFRLFLEISYTILFIYYAVVEVLEIKSEYSAQKITYETRIRKLEEQETQLETFVKAPKDFLASMANPQDPKNKIQKKLRRYKKIKNSCCRLFCLGCGNHFKSTWNWVDVTSLILSFCNIFFWILFIAEHSTVITGSVRSQLQAGTMISAQFATQVWDLTVLHNHFITVVSINAMLIFMRVLKYLSEAVDRVRLLLNTLYASSQMTMYFLVMLLTIFMAFSLMAYLSFGDKVLKFSTFGFSCFSLLKFVLGSAGDLEDAFKLYPELTFIFFVIYMAVMQFILTNLFIGFLGTSYGEVMEEHGEEPKVFKSVGFCTKLKKGSGKFFRRFFACVFRCQGCRKKEVKNKEEPQKKRKKCCGKKNLEKQHQEREDELKNIRVDVKKKEKEADLQSKIFKGEQNTVGKYLTLTEKEERQAQSWNAAPTSGDILSDERVITTLMTEQQLAQQKYKKEQYYGRIFYGGLIFLGFVIIYVIIIAQQLDIEETYLISRDSTKNFKGDVTQDLAPKYSDYKSKMVDNIIPNLATRDSTTGSYLIEGQLVLVNSIYRITFRFADLNAAEPRKLDNFKEKPFAEGQQTTDFTGGNLGNYRTNDGYLNNGGFVVYMNAADVGTQLSQIHNSFDSQQDRLWYITYEYVVYEGSTDRFLNTVIRFLFRKDGSIEGKVDNKAIRLNPYFTNFDKFRIFLEICYVIFLVFFIIFFIRMVIREYRGYNLWYQLNIKPLGPRLMKLRNQKSPQWLRKFLHIFTFFKIFDLASMVTSILSICFWIVYIVRSTQAEVNLPLTSEADQRNFYNNLNQAIAFLDLYTKACSVNTLFMSIRMLKFLNENQQMSVLCKTLINGRLDIFWFMIILFCIMFGFVALANIQFGAYSERVSTFWFSSIMCFQYIIGQFSYEEELGVTNQVLAPLFFVVYMLLFAMILINIFLTIIDTSYQDVKRKVKLATGKQKLSTCNILCFCFKKKNTKRGNLGMEEKDEKEFEYYNERMLTEKKQLQFLEIDLSTQLRDQNAWTLRMAEEIKRELDFRVKMRKDNAEMRKQRKHELQGGTKSKKKKGQKKETYSEFKEFYIRISYWNYLREAIQFVNFQCDRLVVEINKLKEKNIKEEADLQKMKGESKTVYQVIKDMEKPMEDNLKNISTLRRQIKKLRKQYTELNSVKSDLRRKYQND